MDYRFLSAVGLAGVLCPAHGDARPKEERPNVVIIYADDLGYSDLSCYGEKRWTTANLDALAQNGVRFTDFYSASPVSSPSRAGLMTGRYPVRMGICGVFFPDSYTGMPQSEVTIAEVLRERGYRTSIVGKWHLGHRDQYLPLQQGFDEYFGIPYSNDMTATVYLRGNQVEEFHVDQRYMTRKYTEEATDFIRRSADEPFFLYLAHNMMHVPIFCSPEFDGRSGAGLYGDAMLEFDWSVGQVMEALRKAGVEENTIVIFSSDNGPWLKEGPLGGTAEPLREGKGTDYDGGVRVPCIAYWKGKFPAKTESSVACMLDWMPTIARLCGGQTPDVRLDGCDISGVLTGQGERANQDYAYFRHNREVTGLRSGDWKLELPLAAIKGNFWRPSTAARDTVLVNLREDGGETTNLYHKNPEKAREMVAKLNAYVANFGPVPPPLVMNGNNQQKELSAMREKAIKDAQKKGVKSREDEVVGFK